MKPLGEGSCGLGSTHRARRVVRRAHLVVVREGPFVARLAEHVRVARARGGGGGDGALPRGERGVSAAEQQRARLHAAVHPTRRRPPPVCVVRKKSGAGGSTPSEWR
jgi:hypothetical protein